MYDVAIVGYGPVGATLAGLLGRLGLTVAVFDQATEIYPKPRAVGFDHDAMRLFQRVGVCEALAPHIEPFREGVYIGADDRIIQYVKHLPPPYPLTWPPHFTCDQPGVEKILRAAVAQMPNVDVSLGDTFVRYEQGEEGVQIHLKDKAGHATQCSARYLVGCDGASSPVRQQMATTLESFDYDEPWIVVDMKVKPAYLHKLPQTNVQYCKPTRPSTFINCPGQHKRWEFMTLPGDVVDGVVTDETLWRLMSPWIKPGEADIWRAASYRFHALVAHEWQEGRVFLAGDSAHQTPPFLGQGMCQGLRDAGNLAWKLQHVITGQAPANWLNTYTEERRPNVVATTRLAKEFGKIISERDPVKARARDEAIFANHQGSARTVIRQDLIPALNAGCIEPQAPLAGKVFPQPRVETSDAASVWMDDLDEPGFRLVLLADSLTSAELAQIVADAAGYGIRVQCIHATVLPDTSHSAHVRDVLEPQGLIKHWLEEGQAIAALVRPDHYVYAGLPHAAAIRDGMHNLAARSSLTAFSSVSSFHKETT